VFIENDFAPLAELLWFREAASFTDEDRLRTLPAAAHAYHSFGTTSIFEGHGVASELPSFCGPIGARIRLGR
jgi:hypothetical protein